MRLQAEQITGPLAFHGEGPVWLTAENELRWVDQLRGDVLALDQSGEVQRTHLGPIAAVIRPRRAGGTVVATDNKLVLDGGTGHERQVLPSVWSDETIRFNEGGCDPDGRLYVGTMAHDEAPGRGKLYRFDADHSVAVVLESVTVSNGIGWSPDGKMTYYIDSGTRRVDCFDYASGTGLSNRRAFKAIDETAGIPDGLTVDCEGGVWVALWGGSAVHRYSAAGELDEIITIPVSHVTACTFGGATLSELYITTSALGLEQRSMEPMAGSVFRCTPGVAGLPAFAYAG